MCESLPDCTWQEMLQNPHGNPWLTRASQPMPLLGQATMQPPPRDPREASMLNERVSLIKLQNGSRPSHVPKYKSRNHCTGDIHNKTWEAFLPSQKSRHHTNLPLATWLSRCGSIGASLEAAPAQGCLSQHPWHSQVPVGLR